MSEWESVFFKAKNLIVLNGSPNRLAGLLDVSRQAVNIWEREQDVPIVRALQMEQLTGGEVTWRQLSPRTAIQVDEVVGYAN